MIIEKFSYHQPLYRQYVKPPDAGINFSRGWVTKLMASAVSLIEPIFVAQLDSVQLFCVIAMNETPIKAGWPLFSAVVSPPTTLIRSCVVRTNFEGDNNIAA